MNKVSIQSDRNWLRLRWSYNGKRQSLNLGIEDNKVNRAFAEAKAAEIQRDIRFGGYDPTLFKYRNRILGEKHTELTISELFECFTKAMKTERSLSRGGLSKYECVLAHLQRSLTGIKAHQLTARNADNFVSILLEHVTSGTAKQYLLLLSACWQWAQGKYQTTDDNPWPICISKLKPHQSKKIKPFSKAEIQAILAGFKSSKHYKHYYSVVHFLFSTGTRPGEAFGLRWQSIADDFTHAVIKEAVSRGENRDRTKTGKSRVIYLSPAISQMLQSIAKEQKPSASDLVFPGAKGAPINDNNFNKRAWRSVLTSVGVPYRPPYAARHSAISHALSNGANPIELSEQTGHDKRVMLSTYAHAINSKPIFIEFED